MTAAAAQGFLAEPHRPRPTTDGTDRYVETYYDDGNWHSRRHDSDRPFASGDVRVEQIAVGAEVARWNQVRHIVRHRDGSTETTH